MKPTTLPSSHYAAKWRMGELDSVEHINQIGRGYATLPAGAEKQAALLDLCQCFHPYLMKYLSMIRTGHVPMWQGWVNKDTRNFIRYFLPQGGKATQMEIGKAIRHLHLAFKGLEAEEIYDVLMEQFLRAAAKYDPAYGEKLKQVVEVIENALSKRGAFRAADVDRHLEFGGHRYLRLLCRRGFLSCQVQREAGKAVYQRSGTWPPAASLFSEPVGITYYLQKWFQYYLQQWISERMSELEAKEGVYSLDFFRLEGDDDSGRARVEIPSADGAYVDVNGNNWAADVQLINKPLDVSIMTLDWVRSTNDPLFSHLEPTERMLLYLLYAREMEFAELARSLDCSVSEAKTRIRQILHKLQHYSREGI